MASDFDSLEALRVLLVEDDEHDARAARRILERGPVPCRVTHCVRAEDALDSLSARAPWFDVAVVDHALPGLSGLELCRLVLERGIDVPLVMLTGGGSETIAVDAMKAGVSDYLVKDSSERYLDRLATVVPRVVSAHRDRRARERAEAALAESQELFRSFMSHSPAIAYMKDAGGRYVYVNTPFERLFGMTEADWRDHTDAEIWGEEVARKLRENDVAVLADGHALEVEETIPQPDGPHYWLAFKFPISNAAGDRFVGGMAIDVTQARRSEQERRLLETRIQQAHKLESMGIMAAGVARDFNDLLVEILGSVGVARLEVPAGARGHEQLQQVEHAALRAAELTEQMLAYTGQAHALTDTVDLSRLVADLGVVLEATVSANARLVPELDPETPPVEASAQQVRQLVINLVSNASEALAGVAGTVTVRTGKMEADRALLDAAFLGEGLTPGPHAFVEVADTGVGMDADMQARIFDPFFTTKRTGRGLGLATVFGIVKAHHGAIRVESAPGRGTTLRVLLPLGRPMRALRAVAPAAATAQATEPPTRGSVLVVCREDNLRDIARLTVAPFGYGILSAGTTDEALAACREHGAKIVAVLLDVTSPAASDGNALGRLQQALPGVPVVLSSGHEVPPDAADAASDVTAFLRRPYRPLALVRVLQEILGGPA